MSILDEVYEYLLEAHRYERYIASRCPFHPDERPSFFVYEDKYRCASCGAWGDTDKLLDKINGSPVHYQPKPRNFHNPWTKWIEQYGSIEQTLKHAHQYLAEHPSEYLRRRAIPPEYQIKARLGYLDDFYLFPIKNQEGKIVSGVARAGEENSKANKYILPAHHDPHLLYCPNWKKVIQSEYLILVFGIVDSLSLAIAGYPAASTSTGKNLIASVLDWCRKPIYFLPDHSEETDAMRLIAQLGWRGRMIKIDWPIGMKDCNDLSIHCPAFLQTELSRHGINLV